MAADGFITDLKRKFQQGDIVLRLVYVNVAVFLAVTLVQIFLTLFNVPSSPWMNYLELPAWTEVFIRRPWTLITYMFMHANFSHIFFNMFALWMFGRTLEYELGSKRFLTYYMVCGIGAALIQYFTALAFGELPMSLVGASGAVMGLLLAFGVMHPNAVIMLLIPPIPMKAKWFVIIYGVIELFLGWRGVGNVAHFAHVGGMLWGFLLLHWWKQRGIIRF